MSVIRRILLFAYIENNSLDIEMVGTIIAIIGIIGFYIIIFFLLRALIRYRKNKIKKFKERNQAINEGNVQKINNRLAQDGFRATSKLEVKVDTGTFMSFQVDENSRRIVLYQLGKDPMLTIINFSDIVSVKVDYNTRNMILQDPYDYDTSTRYSVRQITSLSSIYLYIDTNDLQKPVLKWGLRFNKPKEEDTDNKFVRDCIDWFNNVRSAIEIIIRKYGEN
jgi:hypothetical protein